MVTIVIFFKKIFGARTREVAASLQRARRLVGITDIQILAPTHLHTSFLVYNTFLFFSIFHRLTSLIPHFHFQ